MSASSKPGMPAGYLAEAATGAGSTIDATRLAAAAAMSAFVVGVWLVSGVAVAEALLYLGYLAGFVAFPGLSVYSLARRPRRLDLECIATGIALGFTLVILGFILGSAAGLPRLARFAAPLFGIAALAAQAPRLSPRRLRLSASRRKDVWFLFAIAAAATLLVALEFFPFYPLPERLPEAGTDYQTDIPWHISNAAGLKSFWPPVDMRAVNVPLDYYVGVHIHAAVASLVTGVELATIFLRLDTPVFIAILALQLFWLGREASGRWQGGALTAAIALLAGDLSILGGGTTTLYYNLFTRNLFLSPTYALGLIVFIPLVVLLGRWMTDGSEDRSRLVLAGVLGAALAWTKLPALPVVGAGCAGVAALGLVVRREPSRRPLVALALVAATIAAMWPFVVMAGGSDYVRFAPLSTFRSIPAYRHILGGDAGGALTAPLRAVATIVGHAPVAMLGLGAFVACRVSKHDAFARWLMMAMLAGAGAVLLFDGAGVGQLWFWLYGHVGLAASAALGYLALGQRFGLRSHRARWAPAAVVALMAVASSAARAYPGLVVAIGRERPKPGALTPARAEAFRWIRENTPPDGVLAIDQFEHVYGSALGERRFLLENDRFMPSSYLYRFTRGERGTAPREELRALTRRIFQEGDPAAIREARDRFGVRYLLDDRTASPDTPSLPPELATRRFGNDAIVVYEVAR